MVQQGEIYEPTMVTSTTIFWCFLKCCFFVYTSTINEVRFGNGSTICVLTWTKICNIFVIINRFHDSHAAFVINGLSGRDSLEKLPGPYIVFLSYEYCETNNLLVMTAQKNSTPNK